MLILVFVLFFICFLVHAVLHLNDISLVLKQCVCFYCMESLFVWFYHLKFTPKKISYIYD